jgi:hypothetical protein
MCAKKVNSDNFLDQESIITKGEFIVAIICN